MDSAQSKLVVKRQGVKVVPASKLELQLGKALFDLQNSGNEIAAELRSLQLHSAREVDLSAGRRVVVLVVPVPQLKAWRKIQARVSRELEKKLAASSGASEQRSVVVIANRRIMQKPSRKTARSAKNQRPRSRTLTAVHENWLEDLVYPTEIVGKRIRVKTDGHRIVKVLLDPKDQTTLENKLDVLSGVYRKLTGKDVVFDFSLSAAEEDPRRK